MQAYACDPRHSRGRRHAQTAAPTRNEFQRDRDRIIHCTAFRRLVYKTQVFLNHEGDLFRTRLTHSLEVAQLGRSIGRELGLNEDLVEAIALAHDLGHTPFGHAGQEALNNCLRAAQRSHAGFEHNLQSLRVVDTLEERFPDYDGLDLCFETREGILKHCSRRHAQQLEECEPGGVARRFLDGTQPSLEAQLCNLADEVAYNAHDIDDGVRSGLLMLEQLGAVELFNACHREARAAFARLEGRRLLFEIIRRMVSCQVDDLIATTRAALDAAAPASVDSVRACAPLVRFSAPMLAQSAQLKQFLRANLYRHPQVVETTDRARRVIADLFAVYASDENSLPPAVAALPKRHRAIADHIAGMTDRYALREHERLTGQTLFP